MVCVDNCEELCQLLLSFNGSRNESFTVALES